MSRETLEYDTKNIVEEGRKEGYVKGYDEAQEEYVIRALNCGLSRDAIISIFNLEPEEYLGFKLKTCKLSLIQEASLMGLSDEMIRIILGVSKENCERAYEFESINPFKQISPNPLIAGTLGVGRQYDYTAEDIKE